MIGRILIFFYLGMSLMGLIVWFLSDTVSNELAGIYISLAMLIFAIGTLIIEYTKMRFNKLEKMIQNEPRNISN